MYFMVNVKLGGGCFEFRVIESCLEGWIYKVVFYLDGCYFNRFLVVGCYWYCGDWYFYVFDVFNVFVFDNVMFN